MKRVTRILLLILLIVLLILLFCWVLKYCSDPPSHHVQGPEQVTSVNPEEYENSLSEYKGYNIKIPDGKSLPGFLAELQAEARKFIPQFNIKEEHYRVCSCDSTIVSLNHPDITIDGHGRAKVNTKEAGEGRDIINVALDYSRNYVLKTDLPADMIFPYVEMSAEFGFLIGPDPKRQPKWAMSTMNPNNAYSFTDPNTVENGNVVAVFDSGLEDGLAMYSIINTIGAHTIDNSLICSNTRINYYNANRQSKILGFNFVNGTKSPYSMLGDSTKMRHGTNVTCLLAAQRVGLNVPAFRIYPFKVLDRHNQGDVFTLMCAMSQAKNAGAKIFNLSLGYYGPEDKVFKSKIREMTDAGIWIVAAAGNARVEQDDPNKSPSANRNLDARPDSSKFYPACFSRDFDRVITVTTVTQAGICEGQNYGADQVDIGVMTDKCFFRVYDDPNVGVEGTSYAAPVVAGWLAMKTNLKVTKEVLLNDARTEGRFQDKIKKNRYITPRLP